MAKILAEEQNEYGQKIGIVLSLSIEEARLIAATHHCHIGGDCELREMWDNIAYAIREDNDCRCTARVTNNSFLKLEGDSSLLKKRY